ncbi:MAG: hypothetical protein LUC24_03765 [Bacteroidales bacterium]|nr:hypothetical protein [Bacteroidales bacterium]
MGKAHNIWRAVLVCLAAAGLFCVTSCQNKELEMRTGLYLNLVVNMSGTSTTRASGEIDDEGENVGPEEQRRLNDVYALIFDESGSSLEYAVRMSRISGDATDAQQTYTAALDIGETAITTQMWIVANVEQNGYPSGDLQTLIGSSMSAVAEALVFDYDCALNDDGQTYTGWDISERCLPMWGHAYLSASEETIHLDPDSDAEVWVYASLHRAVAKMGFSVNLTSDDGQETGDTFTLKEVYVYYANDSGSAVPFGTSGDDNQQYHDPSTGLTYHYTKPTVPTSSTQFGKENPIKYNVNGDTGITDGEEWYNQIFLCESDNTDSDTPVVVVVGGVYAPEGVSDHDEMSYYRIDFTETGGSDSDPVDIIRNHSYLFNIVSVTDAGTSDPDPDRATDALVVEVEDYVEEEMKGIHSQYTLTVNQSAFSFSSQGSDIYTLEVDTENIDWAWDRTVYYVIGDYTYQFNIDDGTITCYNGNGEEVDSQITFGRTGDYYYYDVPTGEYDDVTGEELTTRTILNWMDVTAYGSNTTLHGLFDLVAEPNVNASSVARNAYIYLTAGAIRKKVQFVQNVGATANSILITKAGDYYMNITYRGNSETADEEGDDISFNVSSVIDVDMIAAISIIWETADGMVTFANGTRSLTSSDTEEMAYLLASGCVKFSVNDIPLTFGNWSGSVFDEHSGGNALIGAFDSSGKVLWTWHVWVCTDYLDGVKTELWDSGYEFMDRNLGAYTNYPGSGSFGLLYQWGRKEPFIGAYREDRERDYHIVPKQYTRMYTNPITGEPFAWQDYDDSSLNDESTIVEYTIENPTTLLDDGLLSEKHNLTAAHGFWGARTVDHDAAELGDKTMWDPCPDGYRVPTLTALTIDDGHNDMWYSNVTNARTEVQHSSYTARYVPIKYGDSYRTQSDYTADFVSDAPFYGFWLDYSGTAGYEATYEQDDAAGYHAYYYYDNMTDAQLNECGWISPYSATSPGKPDNVAWLPLAGIYNGSMDHFGRAGLTDRMDGEPYLPASSLQVTSVLWANSPTTTNADYPAGLLLHGTEGAYAPHNGTTTYQYSSGTANGSGGGTPGSVDTEGEGYWTTATTASSTIASGWWTGTSEDGQWNSTDSNFPTPTKGSTDYGSSWYDVNGLEGSGRHFHSYADPAVSTLANPSYAASVRCIVDKDAISSEKNKLYTDGSMETEVSDALDLYQYEAAGGVSTEYDLTIVVYSVESWQVTNPGAKWLSVTPLSGNSDNVVGSSDYLTIRYNTSYTGTAPTAGTSAVITITFLHGSTLTVTVRYAGETVTQ